MRSIGFGGLVPGGAQAYLCHTFVLLRLGLLAQAEQHAARHGIAAMSAHNAGQSVPAERSHPLPAETSCKSSKACSSASDVRYSAEDCCQGSPKAASEWACCFSLSTPEICCRQSSTPCHHRSVRGRPDGHCRVWQQWQRYASLTRQLLCHPSVSYLPTDSAQLQS